MIYSITIVSDCPYILLCGKKTDIPDKVICREKLALECLPSGVTACFFPSVGECVNCSAVRLKNDEFLVYVSLFSPYEIKAIFQKRFRTENKTHLLTLSREPCRSLLVAENSCNTISYILPPVNSAKCLVDCCRDQAAIAVIYHVDSTDHALLVEYRSDYRTFAAPFGKINVKNNCITVTDHRPDVKGRSVTTVYRMEKGRFAVMPPAFRYEGADSDDNGLLALEALAAGDIAYLNGFCSDTLMDNLDRLKKYLNNFRFVKASEKPNEYELWSNEADYSSSFVVRLEYFKGLISNVVIL